MSNPSLANAADDALCAQGLEVWRAGRQIVAPLDFRLERGMALQLLGPNGVGKSSLLRTLAGLIPVRAGRLFWTGGAFGASPGRVAYLGHLDGVKPMLSALESVAFWAGLEDRREVSERARMALAELEIDHLAGTPGRFLSAGQKRRVALARILATARPLWLLDEPLEAIDPAAVARFKEVLRRHLNGGGMAVMASHQPLSGDHVETLTLSRPAEAAW